MGELPTASIPTNNFDVFLPNFPKSTDPKIQSKLTVKAELQKYKGQPDEKLSPEHPFYRNQVLNAKIMNHFNIEMRIDEPGTGKTITFLRSAEDLLSRKNYDSNIQRVIYLAPSKLLYWETMTQLVFRYPGQPYLTAKMQEEKRPRELRKAMRLRLKSNYSFYTYEKFFNENARPNKYNWGQTLASDAQKYINQLVTSRFLNTYFIFDEAHWLNDRTPKIGPIYFFLKHLIRALLYNGTTQIPRAKFGIYTATPINDDITELHKFANLMNPTDIEPEQHLSATDSQAEIERKIKELFLGKVDYARALDTGADLVYRGNRIQITYSNDRESQQIITARDMSPLQSMAYVKAYVETGSRKLWKEASEACDFVMPDGTIGHDAAVRWFSSTEDQSFDSDELRRFLLADTKGEICKCAWPNPDTPDNELEWEEVEDPLNPGKVIESALLPLCECKMNVLNRIGTLSCKAEAACRSLFTVHKGVYPRKGVSFFSFNYIEVALAPMVVCLEALGFERYRYNENKVTVDKIDLERKPRFVAISGRPGDSQISTTCRDVINHKNNVDGSYISVVLGSQITKLGLNFYHCINIGVYGPGWNPGNEYQALFRGYRATGHVDMLELERKRRKDPNARVTVNVYKFCSVPLTVERAVEFIKANKDENPDAVFDYELYLGFLATGKVAKEFILLSPKAGSPTPEQLSVDPELIPKKVRDAAKKHLTEEVKQALAAVGPPQPRERKIERKPQKKPARISRAKALKSEESDEESVKPSKKSTKSRKLAKEEEEDVIEGLSRTRHRTKKEALEEDEVNGESVEEEPENDEEELEVQVEEEEEEEFTGEAGEAEKKIVVTETLEGTAPIKGIIGWPQSLEVRKYQDSEQKDFPNRGGYRGLQRASFTAQLNQKRNVRPTDKPGSAQCNYMECDYKPFDYVTTPYQLDYSTAVIYDSAQKIEEKKAELIETFQETFDASLPQHVIENSLIDRMALFEFQQTPIPHFFGGSSVYREMAGFLLPSSPLESYYKDKLFFVKRGTITEVEELEEKRKITNRSLLAQILSNKSEKAIQSLVESIIDDHEADLTRPESLRTDKALAELPLRRQPGDAAILWAYRSLIFESDPNTVFKGRPSSLIAEVDEELRSKPERRKKAGSQSSSKKKVVPTVLPEEALERYQEAEIDSDKIYIHNLSLLGSRTSDHVWKYQFLKLDPAQLRIYDPGQWKGEVWKPGNWRDMTAAEELIYRPVLTQLINERLEKLFTRVKVEEEQVPLIGLDFPKQKEKKEKSSLRIVTRSVKTREKKKAAKSKKEQSEDETEMVSYEVGACGNDRKFEIANNLILFNYPVVVSDKIKELSTKALEELANKHYETKSKVYPTPEHLDKAQRKEFLQKLVALHEEGQGSNKSKSYNKSNLCNKLRDQLARLDLLIRGVDWETKPRNL